MIGPEIKDDLLYSAIVRVAATPGVRQILEIGSSSGEGSTEAFVKGALANPARPEIHCIEVSAPRHAALARRYAGYSFVHCHHVSSVGLEGFASPAEIEHFVATVDSKLRLYSLKEVLDWRQQDVDYLTSQVVPAAGIKTIKERSGIERFDAVLIDGSEFTGQAELAEVYGAGFVLLDDICTFKNYANFAELSADRMYRLVESADEPRHGYAVFERVGGRSGMRPSSGLPLR